MTNYLKEFEDALDDFLDLTVYFNENEMRYKFQGIWISSNFEKDLEVKVEKLKYLLFRQLKNGLDNKSLLSEIRLKVMEAHNFLYDVYYDDFENLNKSNLKIIYSSALPENISNDLFTYDFFEHKLNNKAFEDPENDENDENDENGGNDGNDGNGVNDGNDENDENEFSMLYKSLSEIFRNYKRNDNTSPSKLQFENAKLLGCIYCYYEILYNLLNTIEHYFYNYDKVDFSKIEVNEFYSIVETVKCNLNLSKVEAARFFSFLIYDKIIFINSSDEKDKVQLQRFIEKNFTYKSPKSKQTIITNINREISEFPLYRKDDYNKVIDDFIKILESKKKV